MPQLSGGGGGGDPELCATDEMIPFKDEGDPHKEQIFAELSHSEEEGDLADIKSSLVNESESSPNSNSHDVSNAVCVREAAQGRPGNKVCLLHQRLVFTELLVPCVSGSLSALNQAFLLRPCSVVL